MKILIFGLFERNRNTSASNNSDLHVGTNHSVNSGVEFNCARYGVEVIGYTDITSVDMEDFHYPIKFISLADVKNEQFDFIIANKDYDKNEAVNALVKYDVSEKDIFSFTDDFPEIIRRFESSTGVAIRTHSVVNSLHITKTEIFDVSKKSIESTCPSPTQEDIRISSILLAAYEFSEKDKQDNNIPAELIAGDNWDGFLKKTRPNFYAAIKNKDTSKLAELLSNFYRNEMSSGILGGEEAYNSFVHDSNHAGNFRRIFNVWKNSVRHPNLDNITCKIVGNPYGVLIDGKIINTNNMLNDVRARMVTNLIGNKDNPVVLEIGGGYGGFADALLSDNFQGTYINFDLPENLIVSSYYLRKCHPDKKIKLYDDSMKYLISDEITKYDIVMLPHYMIEKISDNSIDLSINTISFSEMGYENIKSYIHNLNRVTKEYIYHENMLDGGAGYAFYPESTFPKFDEFELVFSSPSRWPWFSLHSPFHHHGEFLYRKKHRCMD